MSRPVDGERFRDFMGGVCAPVTVVTTFAEGVPYGATVSAFASLSLHPPLVSVAFDARSTVLARVEQTQRFGINVLAHTQDALAMLFARRNADRFGSTAWRLEDGLPRLEATAGWMVCELSRTVEAGDHLLLFGLVVAASRTKYLAPLVYADRTFGTHSRFAERPRRSISDLVAALAR